jgi:soluble lytic murein transglycosylase-like protein
VLTAESTSGGKGRPDAGIGRTRAAAFAVAVAAVCALSLLPAPPASAGAQQYEELSAQVRSALIAAVAEDRAPPEPSFASMEQQLDWLLDMADRLPRRHKPGYRERVEFLQMVHYEATRAGLDPHLVLGLIEVESNFRRFAISSAGARGYMQVMPFWTKVIGDGDPSRLFDARSNLRFGCVILRHYLDIERGDLFRALGRYNGSLGRAEYPNLVLRAWRKWEPRDVAGAGRAQQVGVQQAGVQQAGVQQVSAQQASAAVR